LKWATEFTKLVHQPAYSDFQILLNAGNTDAWNKVVRLLCEAGDYILCEEHTYPSAQALWIPMGIKAVPVAMDAQGMRADDLEKILANWDGNPERRPKLLVKIIAFKLIQLNPLFNWDTDVAHQKVKLTISIVSILFPSVQTLQVQLWTLSEENAYMIYVSNTVIHSILTNEMERC